MDDQKKRLDQLLSYLEQDADNNSLLLDITDLCLQLNDERAEEFCLRTIELVPNNPRARFLHSTLCLQQGDYPQASTLLQQLLDDGIDNPGIRYNLALSLGYSGKMLEIADLLQPLMEQHLGEIPHASILYARSLYHRGEVEQARAALTAHIQRHPQSSEAIGLLAMLYLDLGDEETAASMAKHALSIDSANHEANITLASVELNQYKFASAEQQFDAILQSHPNSGRSWLGIGLVAMAQNRPADAENALQNCVTHMEAHLGSWNALGWAQLVQRKMSEAESTFRTAIERNRTFGDSHGGLACVLALDGDFEEAEHEKKLALRLDPNSYAGRFAEVLLLQRGNKTAESQLNLEALFNAPLNEDGPSLLESLQKVGEMNDNQNSNPNNAQSDSNGKESIH